MFLAIAAFVLVADGRHWSHRQINAYTYEIYGPASASDELRLSHADKRCPKTGWESDSAMTAIRGGRQFKWRIVCRAQP